MNKEIENKIWRAVAEILSKRYECQIEVKEVSKDEKKEVEL